MSFANPFPLSDPDRREIWDMLVQRDTEAFCATDWSRVEPDFCADSFIGIRGGSCPSEWCVAFPSLASYRDAWLRRAQYHAMVTLEGQTTLEFLSAASCIESIDVQEPCAIARKVLKGESVTTAGERILLNWQTMYLLRKDQGRWRITGFVGYIPLDSA
jgi:hypothetical protein